MHFMILVQLIAKCSMQYFDYGKWIWGLKGKIAISIEELHTERARARLLFGLLPKPLQSYG